MPNASIVSLEICRAANACTVDKSISITILKEQVNLGNAHVVQWILVKFSVSISTQSVIQELTRV